LTEKDSLMHKSNLVTKYKQKDSNTVSHFKYYHFKMLYNCKNCLNSYNTRIKLFFHIQKHKKYPFYCNLCLKGSHVNPHIHDKKISNKLDGKQLKKVYNQFKLEEEKNEKNEKKMMKQ
jgi:hypothetical protein